MKRDILIWGTDRTFEIRVNKLYRRDKLKNYELMSLMNKSKNDFIMILITAVFLGLSISILATMIVEEFLVAGPDSIIIFSLCVVALLFLIIKLLTSRLNKKIKLQGALSFEYQDKKLKLLDISRYELQNSITESLEAAFVENKAYQKIWDNFSKERLDETSNKLSYKTLINHAFAYFALQKTSYHLQEYFSKNEINKSELVSYSRDNIHHLLSKNTFLDMFTKPMEERQAFMSRDDHDSNHRVVYSIGDNGEIYKYFDLELPKKSIINIDDDGSILIKTKVFMLKLRPRFDGMNTLWPFDFHRLYIGVEHYLSLVNFQLDLDIEVEFNLFSLFVRKNWVYYLWLDSLIEKLSNTIEKDKFLDKIGWDTVYTSYLVSSNNPQATSLRSPKLETDTSDPV